MIRRRPADPGNERLRRIEAVTDAALSSLQLDDLLAELLERTRELLSVDTATILLVDETTDELVATAARGLEEEVRQGIRIPIGSGFAGKVAAQARPIVLDRVDRTTVVNQILIDKHLNSMAGIAHFRQNIRPGAQELSAAQIDSQGDPGNLFVIALAEVDEFRNQERG